MLHRILGICILIFIGVLLGLKYQKTPSQQSESVLNSSYSYLKELDKKLLDLRIQESDHKITLINFWASWCVPCLKEMPDLVALHEAYSNKGLQLILISTDDQRALKETVEILERNSVEFETYYRGSLSLGILDEIYPNWNGALPASLILDKDGNILDAWFGETTKAQFEARINSHL